MNIIELAKEADIYVAHLNKPMTDKEVRLAFLERFAALVREQTLKDDKDLLTAYLVGFNAGAEREWVDITKAEQLYLLASHIDKLTGDVMGLSLIDAVIAAFKEKNK